MSRYQGRLELTWTNKEKALLSTGDGRYDYAFVEVSDRRVAEVRLLREVDRVEAETPAERPEDLPSPTTDNLLITGDAMHALDALARIPEYAEKYLGQVKLVYIDPPFNTGQAFTNYEDNIEHSVWLTMLRDRLRQIKPLLAPDASVWVHLDDVEVHRCRVIMDEELGAKNFVSTIIWQKSYSPRNDKQGMSTDQDYILVYALSEKWHANRLPRDAERDLLFRSPDNDPRPWVSDNPAAPGAVSGKNQHPSVFGIQSPVTGDFIYPSKGRHWGKSQANMKELLEEWGVPYKAEAIDDAPRRSLISGIPESDLRTDIKALVVDMPLEASRQVFLDRMAEGNWPTLYFTKGGFGGLKIKTRLTDIAQDRTPQTLWFHEEVGHNRTAKNEIGLLLPEAPPFATPKPEQLLERVIHVATDPGDVVLDCFVGSGTTAAVAHKMGRRWVGIELLASTMSTYAKPRLTKVVRGEDPGGITSSTVRVPKADVELPDGLSPAAAQAFNTSLTRVIEARGLELSVDLSRELATLARRGLRTGNGPLNEIETKSLLSLLKKFGSAGRKDFSRTVKAQLAAATATRDQVSTVWHGGGRFTHLEVAPSMFVEVEGMVLLADWATQNALTEAMCAQLGVRYAPDGVFAGTNGRTRVVVIDGMVGTGTIDSIVDQLLDGENVEIWATQVTEDAVEYLKGLRPGSRLHQIPSAVLDSYRRKQARRSPFGNTTAAEGARTDG